MPRRRRGLPVTSLRWGGLALLVAIGTFGACSFDRRGSLSSDVTTASTSSSGASTSSVGVGGAPAGGMTTSVEAATSSGASGIGGADTTMASGAGGAPPPGCGNGVVDADIAEGCDDGNNANGDGCSAFCDIEASSGWSCAVDDNETSVCTHTAVVTNKPGSALAIVDDGYDGKLASMQCLSIAVPGDGEREVTEVLLEIALQHQRIGNVVLKLVAPDGTTLTVMSRPGFLEVADDGADSDAGEDANAHAMSPIRFRDEAATGAESVGEGLSNMEAVCATPKHDPDPCEFYPEPGDGGSGTNFQDFVGMPPEGQWRVCLGDAVASKNGSLHGATLTVRSR
jgi:cysteine-rich repeat protein